MPQKIDFKRVGRRIHEARERMGMTQQRLSDIVNCESNHISAIETGVKRPSIDLLARISEALDTSVDYFLMDAPHISRQYFIDSEIKAKLNRCSSDTLKVVNDVLDSLLEYQENKLAKQGDKEEPH